MAKIACLGPWLNTSFKLANKQLIELEFMA